MIRKDTTEDFEAMYHEDFSMRKHLLEQMKQALLESPERVSMKIGGESL